ncbi:hypothetical protein [Modestobacter sp. SSW1-42]|uniref:hypothetical protein n=1 Tax=Modestobacter sp. SSW1-42 TaxID=596372 RepID=UPI003987B1FD
MTVRQSGPAPRDATEGALLRRLEALADEHAAVPDPAYRAATRSRLVAMAAVRTPGPAPGGVRRLLAAAGERRRRRPRLVAGVAGAALALTALGGVLAASQDARPGDLLYPVKRGGEQTRLSLAAADERGLTELGFATTRLQEAGDLVGVSVAAAPTTAGSPVVRAAGPDAGLLVDTLAAMDAQTTHGTADLTTAAVQRDDAAAVEVLVGWAGAQRAGLTALSPAVPADARDAVAAAGRLVDEVAARGAALRAALACPAGPATDGADALGPRPAPCAPPSATPPTTGEPDASSAASRTTGAPRTSPSAPTSPGAQSGSGGGAPGAGLPVTAVPRPTGSAPRPALPSPTLPAPTLPGRPAPSVPSPSPSVPSPSMALPSVPAPSVPVPTVSLPPVPGRSAPAATSPGAVVPLPPVVPGVRVCLPPVVTVDCRPSGG